MESTGQKQRKMADFRKIIETNLVIFFLATLAAGFLAGWNAYTAVLTATNQVTVIKDTFTLNKDLAGRILRSEAVQEIDYLIEAGKSIGNDSQKRVWLSQVLSFVHGIELEKDFEWHSLKVSATEADIRYAFEDPSLDVQVQKTLGVLKGLRGAMQTRVAIP